MEGHTSASHQQPQDQVTATRRLLIRPTRRQPPTRPTRPTRQHPTRPTRQHPIHPTHRLLATRLTSQPRPDQPTAIHRPLIRLSFPQHQEPATNILRPLTRPTRRPPIRLTVQATATRQPQEASATLHPSHREVVMDFHHRRTRRMDREVRSICRPKRVATNIRHRRFRLTIKNNFFLCSKKLNFENFKKIN